MIISDVEHFPFVGIYTSSLIFKLDYLGGVAVEIFLGPYIFWILTTCQMNSLQMFHIILLIISFAAQKLFSLT
jgi:hypothetical protein